MDSVYATLWLVGVTSSVLFFVVLRRFEHIGGMTTPFTGSIAELEENGITTLTGKVEPLEGLIPSPVLGDPPVLAWALETIAGSQHRGQLVCRWAPFRLVRPEGEPLDVRGILTFTPKNSRTEHKFAERDLCLQALEHLRTQQQASAAQLQHVTSWLREGGDLRPPEEVDDTAPAEAAEPTSKQYRLSVLRPGDDLTLVTSVYRVGSPTEVFLLPRLAYPLAYARARSPFHGQGRLVLALSTGFFCLFAGVIAFVWVANFFTQ